MLSAIKSILPAIVLLMSFGSVAQPLQFTVAGAPDGPVYLTKYVGASMRYADTTYSKNGFIEFDGSKHPAGMYSIYFPNTSYFDFLHDKEPVEMATDTLNVTGHMKVTKSVNNMVYYDLIAFNKEHQAKVAELNGIYSSYPTGSREQDSIAVIGRQLDREYAGYQENIMVTYKDFFVADVLRMSLEIVLPEPPRDMNGAIIDPNFVYNYYINHYWDNFNLRDPRIVHTPMFGTKLDNFFSSETLVQHPDTIIYYAHKLLSKMDMTDQNNLVFQYTLGHITDKYQRSPYMGMDKIVWAMGVNYFCPPNNKAYWMSKNELDKFCLQVQKTGRTLIGGQASSLILPDSTGTNWINMNTINATYTVVVFWDPECDHCREAMPQLSELYNRKFKSRDIALYAVSSAEDANDFMEWKNIIRDNKLSFINVGMVPEVYNQMLTDPAPLLAYTNYESLNYPETWDIYNTPMIFLLDQNKSILYKKLSVSQLEEILDELTGHESDAKLYPAVKTPNH